MLLFEETSCEDDGDDDDSNSDSALASGIATPPPPRFVVVVVVVVVDVERIVVVCEIPGGLISDDFDESIIASFEFLLLFSRLLPVFMVLGEVPMKPVLTELVAIATAVEDDEEAPPALGPLPPPPGLAALLTA